VNRFPTWKYALIGVAIIAAFLYTLPNFFGESPAVQVSSGKATVKMEPAVLGRVEEALKAAAIPYTGAIFDQASVRVRFTDPDTQLKARDTIERALNPNPADPSYVVALNLVPASPGWLRAIHALPMYLGLDLRGGVHFLLQVDMQAALVKRLESVARDVRSELRAKEIRDGGIRREGPNVRVQFRDAATRDKARGVLLNAFEDVNIVERDTGESYLLFILRLVVYSRRSRSAALAVGRTSVVPEQIYSGTKVGTKVVGTKVGRNKRSAVPATLKLPPTLPPRPDCVFHPKDPPRCGRPPTEPPLSTFCTSGVLRLRLRGLTRLL
jgi:preprotein translocase subunit SecD